MEMVAGAGIGRPFRAPDKEVGKTQGVALGWYRPRLRRLKTTIKISIRDGAQGRISARLRRLTTEGMGSPTSHQIDITRRKGLTGGRQNANPTFSGVRLRSLILVALALVVALAGCSTRDDPYLQGYVEGEYVYIAPPVNGILETLDVTQGDQVTSGALLFTMNSIKERAAVAEAEMKLRQGEALLEDARLGQRPSEIKAIEAQLKQAEAALMLSSRVHERQKKLFGDKVISAEELDHARSDAEQKMQEVSQVRAQLATAKEGSRAGQVAAAEANVRALRAALEQSQWNLEQTSQTAPQRGLVFDTFFRPGEVIPAGRAVVSLLPPENIRVRAFLDEAVISQVMIGTTATITVDGIAERIPGHVSFISPQAEFTPPVIYSREMRQKLSFMIELSFAPDVAEKLHPGQPVEVQIPGLFP